MTASDPNVLLVDDEPQLLRSTSLALRTSGIANVQTFSDSREVERFLSSKPVAVALIDLNMPHIGGEALLQLIKQKHPEIAVIILTAANEVDTAVDCMKNGAFDYMVKPVEKTRLVSSVNRALEAASLRSEVSSLRQNLLTRQLAKPEAFEHIITENDNMRDLCCYIDAIARSAQPVLITGETGTGKELFARAVHNASGRNGQFVAVTVSGLDDSTFSDTLFGHKKGAFTGADAKRDGLIASAEHGTLFLDEIGDLSIASQVKLLRLVQEREYYPLGEDLPRLSTARIVVATNVDLNAAIKRGDFRQDLYYRLKPHHVWIAPLRERMDDLPLLIEHFIERAARELDCPLPSVPTALYQLLNTYDFPGNVRELETVIAHAVIMAEGPMIVASDLPEQVQFGAQPRLRLSHDAANSVLSLAELEANHIQNTLTTLDGNQTQAAKLLGISRSTLWRKMKEYEIPAQNT